LKFCWPNTISCLQLLIIVPALFYLESHSSRRSVDFDQLQDVSAHFFSVFSNFSSATTLQNTSSRAKSITDVCSNCSSRCFNSWPSLECLRRCTDCPPSLELLDYIPEQFNNLPILRKQRKGVAHDEQISRKTNNRNTHSEQVWLARHHEEWST
jgi:hypothetical protein